MNLLRKIIVSLCLPLFGLSAYSDQLTDAFKNPPDQAKPYIWWHWMSGNISKEGITADLESMKKAGIGGLTLFDVVQGVPEGNIKCLSPEWFAMLEFAMLESKRLGLEFSIHNAAGWSSSGGPWISPEMSMKFMVSSEIRVKGPSVLKEMPPRPEHRNGFYKDIAVLAFPLRTGTIYMEEVRPALESDIKEFKSELLTDNNKSSVVSLPADKADDFYILLRFPGTFKAQSLIFDFNEANINIRGEIQVSDDGQTFRKLRTFAFSENWAYTFSPDIKKPKILSLGTKPIESAFYKIIFKGASGQDKNQKAMKLSELTLSPLPLLEDVDQKAVYTATYDFEPFNNFTSSGTATDSSKIINLTGNLKNGKAWNVPEGLWVIQRIGYTSTGKKNVCSRDNASGLECDKMDQKAINLHWKSMMEPILSMKSSQAVLKDCLIDSYEVGGQNWTEGFAEEFKKRNGYDMLRFMPVFNAYAVDNVSISERFLFDFRNTVSDMMNENYFSRFSELCHQNGLSSSIEAYGGPFKNQQSGKSADILMGEFWCGKTRYPANSCKQAASAAHVYGKNIVAAEAFTSGLTESWKKDPSSFKAEGDLQFCGGLNRLILHSYVHQPWTDLKGGLTLGHFGSPFNRANTWWEQSGEWLKYIARTQYLLQQGAFAADLCVFSGESSPNGTGFQNQLKEAGYDYDIVNTDILLNSLSAKNGLIRTESGQTYKMMFIPPLKYMSVPVLEKIKQLLEAGATIASSENPLYNPSLQNYPASDAKFKKLVSEIWGDNGFTETSVRACGKGKLIYAEKPETALKSTNIIPDFQYKGSNRNTGQALDWIHRRTDSSDIYFLSNQSGKELSLNCRFRVTGKIPELWNPENGKTENLSLYHSANGITEIPICLNSDQSLFIVFRSDDKNYEHPISAENTKVTAELKILKAIYGSDKQCRDVTGIIQNACTGNTLSFKVTNSSLEGDPAPGKVKELILSYSIGDKIFTLTAPENKTAEISAVASLSTQACRIESENDRHYAVFSENGSLSVKFRSGKESEISCNSIPKPIELTMPWNLHFPKKDGNGKECISMEKLVPLTKLSDENLKYFSGTVMYSADFEIPENFISKNSSLILNLGNVKNLAEVTLNGRKYPVAWKSPYQLDISDAVKTGENHISINVTNLAANSMIGDEQLPDDCEWNGSFIKKWPEWLKDGNTARRSGRQNLLTYKAFSKSSPLLDSGLLGPVSICSEHKILIP